MSEDAADIDRLVAHFDATPEGPAKDAGRALLAASLSFHRQALVRVLELVRRSGPPGEQLLERFAEDGLVSSLLVLHDVHPQDLGARAQAAVERMRAVYPDLELVEVSAGRVRARVGGRDAPPAFAATIEASLLEAVPDARAIDVMVVRSPGLVSLRRKEPSP